MTPKSFLNPEKKDQILKGRKQAYLQGFGCNHWPHEFNKVPTGTVGTLKYDLKKDYKPVEETARITSLLGMSDEEYN